MRIIAGKAKGRRLISPKTSATRPVTDRAREAVFSSLGASVQGADVADLYAGSGSFGLEALSRGARSALFVEKARPAIEALSSNIDLVGLGGTVVADDVGDFLRTHDGVFHLMFIDPPWDLGTAAMEVHLEAADRLLRPLGDVVVSRRHTDPAPRAPKTWRVATDKRYGDTRILRYSKAEATDDHGDVPGEL